MNDSARLQGGDHERLTIGVFSESAAFLQSARSRLTTVPQYEVIEAEAGAALIAGRDHPELDLVLFDVGNGAILENPHLPEFRRAFGAIPFIVVSEELSPDHIRRLVQLTSTDWLRQPIDSRVLLDAVAQQLQGLRIGKSDIYAFVPCTGGAGATSLAIAAAAHLAQGRGRRRKAGTVCLVDLDFSSGACGQYLDLVNDFGIDGVITNPDRIDLQLLDILKRDHEAGFSLLSFRRPDLAAGGIPEDFVYRLLDVLSYRYPKVVVDLPSYATRWSDQILRGSDRVMLVTELTVPGLKYARDLQLHLIELGKSPDDLYVVINRDRPRRLFSIAISRKEAEEVFKTKRIHVLPDDWTLMADALNQGVPASTVNSRAKLVKRMGTLFQEALASGDQVQVGR